MSVVEEIGQIHFEGNIIPPSWLKHIRTKAGKPDTIAVVLLSEIVYWYRPVIVRDETTGEVIGYRKKFKGDKLSLSYALLADRFGFTKRQVKEAIRRLKANGLIKIEFRTVKTDAGKMPNVLFIEPVPERIREISFVGKEVEDDSSEGEISQEKDVYMTEERHISDGISEDISQKDVRHTTEECHRSDEILEDTLQKDVIHMTEKCHISDRKQNSVIHMAEERHISDRKMSDIRQNSVRRLTEKCQTNTEITTETTTENKKEENNNSPFPYGKGMQAFNACMFNGREDPFSPSPLEAKEKERKEEKREEKDGKKEDKLGSSAADVGCTCADAGEASAGHASSAEGHAGAGGEEAPRSIEELESKGIELSKQERMVIAGWDEIVGIRFKSEWIPALREALEYCTPAQIRNAILLKYQAQLKRWLEGNKQGKLFSGSKSKPRIPLVERGFPYLLKPLKVGAFGHRKKLKERMASYSDAFERFWGVYPKRLEKEEAWQEWLRCLRMGYEEEELFKAGENFAKYCDLAKKEMTYIPLGKNFFKRGIFRDFIKAIPDEALKEIHEVNPNAPPLTSDFTPDRFFKNPDGTYDTRAYMLWNSTNRFLPADRFVELLRKNFAWRKGGEYIYAAECFYEWVEAGKPGLTKGNGEIRRWIKAWYEERRRKHKGNSITSSLKRDDARKVRAPAWGNEEIANPGSVLRV